MLLNKKRAIELMDHYKVDALIASSAENVTYAGDFPQLHGCMSDTAIYVVLPRDQNASPVVTVSKNAVDIFLASDSWIDDIKLWGEFFIFESEKIDYEAFTSLEKKYTQVIREMKPEPNALEALAKALQERGLINARLGFDEKNLSPVQYEKIISFLPRAKIVPANHIFRRIRMVKTEEEIKRLKKAAQINERGMQALLDALKVGRTERELASIHHQNVRQEGGTPYHGCVQGGTRGALVNGEPTDYAFKIGDGVRLDFDCTYSGYYSDMARTAVVGTPSRKLRTYYGAVLAGLLSAEEVIRPEVSASEVFRTTIAAVRNNGIPHFDRHHVGHGLGLGCYDPPLISPNDETQLEVGTVVNIETPYYEIGFGCVHVEDTVVVTKTGCERLQTSSLELRLV